MKARTRCLRVYIIHLYFPLQFALKVQDDAGENVEVAFLDARRLGRVRLCSSPLTEPPISTLGFDPLLSMPDLQYFSKGVLKRTCPIKALLLDQSFSAGIGNWVAGTHQVHSSCREGSRAHISLYSCQMKYYTMLEYIPKSDVTVLRALKSKLYTRISCTCVGRPSKSTQTTQSFRITGSSNIAGWVPLQSAFKANYSRAVLAIQGKGKKKEHSMKLVRSHIDLYVNEHFTQMFCL